MTLKAVVVVEKGDCYEAVLRPIYKLVQGL